MSLRAQEIVLSAVFLMLAIAIWWSAAKLLDGAGQFPQIAAALIGISAVMTLAKGVLYDKTAQKDPEAAAWGRISLIVLACAIALYLLRPFGFPIVAGILFFVCSRSADSSEPTLRSLVITALVALSVVAILTATFAILLGVSLPMGPLAR